PEKQNPGTINMAVARKLWIHCNRCFTHFVNRQSIMFLLACKHVICEKCVAANLGRTPSDAPTYKCPMCQQLVRGRQLGNSMPSNLKDMFHPQPWLDGIHHDVVDTFQRANCDHLDKHLKEK
ncbi:CG2709, partial [Drosophila busckii]